MTPLAFAWLAAYRWAIGIAVGALLWLAISYVAPIRWFAALRPIALSLAWGTVALAIGWLPVLWQLPALYPWVEADPHPVWLSIPAFVGRTVGTLVIWIVSVAVLSRSRSPTTAVVVLLVAGPAWSVFAFDAWMSLDPHWHSSIYGLLAFGSGMRDALAAIVLVAGLADGRLGRPTLPPDIWHALGRLQLTFVIIWMYLMFAQLFIIWIAALPTEIGYYLQRWSGGWQVLSLWLTAWFPAIGILLLSRDLKRDRRVVMAISAALLAGGVADAWWTVLPHRGGVALVDLAAVVVMGAVLAATVALTLRRSASDPDTGASLAYRSR